MTTSAVPISVVGLFPGERRALVALLAGLSAAQWVQPTACPGWSVHDVALHLFGDDVGRLSRGRDGYRGPTQTGPAPGSDGSAWDALVAFINQNNAAWVHGTRRISPRLLCELLRMTGRATGSYFATLDLQAVGAPVDWAGPDPAPVWLDVAREYTERWVHQQQIRDAVGLPGLKEARWFAPVLATFVRALPYALRRVTAPQGTQVQLQITGAAGGVWWAVRRADAWALGPENVHTPLTIIRLDQETAWRLWTKGLAAEQALQRISCEGDPAPVAALLEMVTILA